MNQSSCKNICIMRNSRYLTLVHIWIMVLCRIKKLRNGLKNRRRQSLIKNLLITSSLNMMRRVIDYLQKNWKTYQIQELLWKRFIAIKHQLLDFIKGISNGPSITGGKHQIGNNSLKRSYNQMLSMVVLEIITIKESIN
jgi:hypothetical protein